MTRRNCFIVLVVLTLPTWGQEATWGRGFGGFHGGGMHMGGMHMGGMPHGNRAYRGGYGGVARMGGYGGASRMGGFNPGNIRVPNFGNAQFNRRLAGGNFNRGGLSRGAGVGGNALGGRGREIAEGHGPARAGMGRPSQQQLGNFLSLPSDMGHSALHGHQALGHQALGRQSLGRAALGQPSAGRMARNSVEPGNRSRLGAGIGANRITQRGAAVGRRGPERFHHNTPAQLRDHGEAVRRQFRDRDIYSRSWYRRYPGAWRARRWAYGDAWAWATWASLYGWFGYDAWEPIYYDYGGTINYQDGSVYVNGQDAGTSDQYYQQAQDLAATGATTEAANDDESWLPLGVFSMTHGDQSKTNLVLQLAVNKQGILRGNYTDTALANDSRPVHGSVDKKTQRAAWTIGKNTDNVIETGIYNLTKDEAPVLVHFGKDRTEQWVLVRLKKDGSEAKGR